MAKCFIKASIFSEENYNGNCSVYYIGKNDCFTGTSNKKLFNDIAKAEKTKDKIESNLLKLHKSGTFSNGSYRLDIIEC